MSSNEPGLNKQFLCDKLHSGEIMYLHCKSQLPKRIFDKEFKV